MTLFIQLPSPSRRDLFYEWQSMQQLTKGEENMNGGTLNVGV